MWRAQTRLIYYLEEDGTVPIVEWLARLPPKANAKCHVYLTRLESEGHELRRPNGDYLRDGIYELRPSLGGVHYRILYFFQGNEAVVVSHGLTKERDVPGVDIERAIRRMKRFRSDPPSHTFVPAKGA
jgi:phage-related protein